MDFGNDDVENTCPLCMEEMDLTDRQLKPCKCGYEICVWCWHHVMEVAEKDNTEGRCPACRTPYDKEKIVGMTVNCQRLMDASCEKRQKSQKSKAKASEMRKHLSNVRVIQRNLVYIIGIPSSLADEETLERREFFGQYGKVLKVSISRSSPSNQHSSSNPTSSVYITYTKEEEAIRCIQAVNGYVLDGRPLRACFGTTKYCHAWLKNMPCNNPDCLYLHDIGTQEDSFTKEEMVSPCAIKIPQFHGSINPSQRRGGNILPPPEPEVSSTNSASSSKVSVKPSASNVGSQARSTIANGTIGKSTALPAAASWGLRSAQGKVLPTKTPAIPVSTKVKSSSPNTLSVSPPSNFPTSATVVAAATTTPLLHCDQSKSSLVAISTNVPQPSQHLPCFVSSKQNVKNHQTSRTNLTNSSGADSSYVIATSERHIRQVSPEKKPCETNAEQKHGIPEDIERTSDNTLPNSSFPGSLHVEQSLGTEKSDWRHCQDVSLAILCNHDDLNNSVLNENSKGFHTGVHASKPSLDERIFSANISEGENLSCPQTSMVEAMSEVCITEIVDLQSSNEPDEQHSGAAQMLSETGRTKHASAIDANQRPVYSKASTIMAEVRSPCGAAFSKDNLSSGLLVEASNFDILDGNGYKTCTVGERTESSCSMTCNTSCSLPPFHVSGVAIEDSISRASGQISEQSSEGQLTLAKSQCLGSHGYVKPDTRDSHVGEESIISDILSMNFDIWENTSIASPQNLAKLLGEKDRTTGFPKDISSSLKSQTSGQSRFSFARQDESSRQSSLFLNSLTSNGQLQDTQSKGKEALDDGNYDQVNGLFHDMTACDREEYQMFKRNTPPSLPGPAVVPLSVSRSQFSAPPGFSRVPLVPPPGFFPQSRADKPYESNTTSVFANGTKDHDDSLSLQNAFPSTYNLHQTLGSNSSNDVEFIDPAIMAVGRGKLPVAQIQRGSAGPDSVFSGPRQDVSNSSFSQSFLGLRNSFPQQVPIDYDARLQMLKQKSIYANASLVSPRQQLKFQDQVGDAFTSYLSRHNDTMIPSMMMEPSQMNLDSAFPQMSFQQPMNSTYRSASLGANGWDSWNRMNSQPESGLGERRLEASLMEFASKERMGLLDPKSGLSKIFPSYGESMFRMPSSENYYSRPFEM